MSEEKRVPTSEQESRQVAEAAREAEWKEPSFLRELFLGRLRLGFLREAQAREPETRPEFTAFFERLKEKCKRKNDCCEPACCPAPACCH